MTEELTQTLKGRQLLIKVNKITKQVQQWCENEEGIKLPYAVYEYIAIKIDELLSAERQDAIKFDRKQRALRAVTYGLLVDSGNIMFREMAEKIRKDTIEECIKLMKEI